MPIPLVAYAAAAGLGLFWFLQRKNAPKAPGAVPFTPQVAEPLPPGVVQIPGLKVSAQSAAVAEQLAADNPNAVVNPDPLGDPQGNAVAIFEISRQFQASGTPKEEADRLARQQVLGTP